MIQVRRWVWYPTAREQAAFLGLALFIVPLLGLFAIPKFPAFKEFEAIQGSFIYFLLWSAALLVFNFAVFFMNARGDYLSVRSGRVPIAISFLVLSVAFTCAWAIYRLILKDAPLLSLSALAAGSVNEWTRVARTLFVGQGGLMMVLFFSGIWKPPPPETLEISQAWHDVSPLIERLYRGPKMPTWSPNDAKQLRARLDQIAERAGKLVTRKLLPDDEALANDLAKHAAAIRGELNIPLTGFADLRDDLNLKESFLFMLGEPST